MSDAEQPPGGEPEPPAPDDSGQPDDKPDDNVRQEAAQNAEGAGEAESTRRRTRHESKRDPADKPDIRGAQQVTMNFHGGVDASGAYFGIAGGDTHQVAAGKATGRLSAKDVAVVVGRYARPGCFDAAAERLRTEHILVLEGRPGMGRRAGAIALLDQVGAAPLYLLSPSVTLRQLAERDYDRGSGYLVVDRFSERNTKVSDFTWTGVRDQVIDAGAYLIVTTGTGVRGVPHLGWERPPVDQVLVAQLSGRGVEENEAAGTVRRIAGDLPEEVSLAGLAGVAELIANGRDPAEALGSLRDNAADEVRSWFAEEPDDRKVLEVTALCFVERVDVRSFEFTLDRLIAAMVKRLPGKYRKALTKPEHRPLAARGRRVPLMHVKEVAAEVGTASIVVFKDEEYHRSVLAELWRTQDSGFWDGVAEWLDEIVGKGDSLPAAYGLAALAGAAFEEVNNTYLQPWSRGAIGLPGQFTAIYVLWYLCRQDMAPVALQTAVGWAGGRDPDQRWSATVAFGGILGRAYPVEAVNQLWRQLVAHGDDLRSTACGAMAQLFAGLTDDPGSDAKPVPALLDPKMRKYGAGIGAERMRIDDLTRLRNLVMAVSLAVLEIRSLETGQPAIVRYLLRHPEPDRLDMVARIWAGVLRHRPHRRQAILALRSSLRSLREASETPRRNAELIGAALARALPETEHAGFKRDFQTVNQQLNRGQKDLSADLLLACLNAISLAGPGALAGPEGLAMPGGAA